MAINETRALRFSRRTETIRMLNIGKNLAVEASDRNWRKGGPRSWRGATIGELNAKVIEEAYEFVEAVLSGDPERMREEYGDLVFSASMTLDHDELLGDWGHDG